MKITLAKVFLCASGFVWVAPLSAQEEGESEEVSQNQTEEDEEEASQEEEAKAKAQPPASKKDVKKEEPPKAPTPQKKKDVWDLDKDDGQPLVGQLSMGLMLGKGTGNDYASDPVGAQVGFAYRLEGVDLGVQDSVFFISTHYAASTGVMKKDSSASVSVQHVMVGADALFPLQEGYQVVTGSSMGLVLRRGVIMETGDYEKNQWGGVFGIHGRVQKLVMPRLFIYGGATVHMAKYGWYAVGAGVAANM